MLDAPPARKYSVFISYKHADNQEMGRKWASWLHEMLESYEVPSELIGKTNERGDPIPASLYPVFRDEQELSATPDLNARIYHALENTGLLVVICSPRSAQSTFVADEIRYFKKLGKSNHILPFIIDGEPYATNPQIECYPESLRFGMLNSAGEFDWKLKCPKALGADVRVKGRREQGWTTTAAYQDHLELKNKFSHKRVEADVAEYASRLNDAKLKIISGALGYPLGALTQRDKVAQLAKAKYEATKLRRWLTVVGTLGLMAVIGGWFAWQQKNEAQTARLETANQLKETTRQLERSQLEEGKAWLERARTAQEAGDHLTAILLAGRSLGFAGFGREKSTPEWHEKFPPLLGNEMIQDTTVKDEARAERKAAEEFIDQNHPSMLPIWSSPVGAHHQDMVTCVAYSQDGTRLATGSKDQTVKLWNSATGRELTTLAGHKGGVTSVAFSPDGNRLVSGSEDSTVKLWDCITGKDWLPSPRTKTGSSAWLSVRTARAWPVGQMTIPSSCGIAEQEKNLPPFLDTRMALSAWSSAWMATV